MQLRGTTRSVVAQRNEEDKRVAKDQEQSHMQQMPVEDDSELKQMLELASGRYTVLANF